MLFLMTRLGQQSHINHIGISPKQLSMCVSPFVPTGSTASGLLKAVTLVTQANQRIQDTIHCRCCMRKQQEPV